MRTLATIHGQTITQGDDLVFSFVGSAQVDADGSPTAYNTNDKLGEDIIADAMDGKQYVGVVTDKNGNPLQQPNGFYISTTSLQNTQYTAADQGRYINADIVPYVVVPSVLAIRALGVVLGCKVSVQNIKTGKTFWGVCADVGPANKLGEVSVAMAKLLGVNSSAKTGGDENCIYRYTFFPNQPAEGFKLQRLA